MDTIFERLTKLMLESNKHLNPEMARKWVEALWEDFESTNARAGREYRGKEMTEMIVSQWIKNIGPRLHEFASKNEKFKHLSNEFENN
ncbi:MAG: YfhJ family protein [Bacillaceae bacterium]|nr:YfhJ family protein [Bacillaceae bacterium]